MAEPRKFDDPPRDSLFHKLNERSCCCTVCHAVIPNTGEARDAHLNEAQCHAGGRLPEGSDG